MCGLVGFAGAGGRSDLEAMTRLVAHRGPDGEGFFLDRETRVFLGHRRLAIVDIAGGAQPMASPDGQIVVVYNGEIYNHRELRSALIAKGHVFRTDHSDTEALIHGWREWGTGLPEKLNGMFAFAIWDRAAGTIFLARDRFGEKPLYWALRGGVFLFASELTAFKGHSAFVPEIEHAAVKKLLAYGFIPSPNAYWKHCHKLPGGSWLRYSVPDNSIRQQDYWRFSIEPDETVTEQQAVEEVRARLMTAVERRLMSDVPLGIFLSGGVDSSAVAACAMAARKAEGIDSFAIGFTEASYDELRFAAAMADAAGTRHRLEVLTLSSAQALVPDVLGRLDEPLGDPSILPTFLLCRFARRHVTVALSGDGGDELFAGDDTFAALKMAGLYRALMPPALHRGMRRLVELLPKSNRNMSLDFKLRRALAGVGHGPELWNPLWLAPLEPSAMAALFNEKVDAEDLYSEALDIWRRSTCSSVLDRSLEFYTRLYLQDNILAKADRASMMNGLETRSVFLDNDLTDYVRRVPHRLKVRAGTRKYVLKKALKGLVPKELLDRPKKGFGIPLMQWLRHLDCRADGIPGASAEVARRLHARHMRGEADYRSFLWCSAVLANAQSGSACPAVNVDLE